MKISIVMVDGGFREHFHIVESLNSQTFPKEDFEVIWVEFYSKIDDRLNIDNGIKAITLDNPSSVEYHSSYCFNEGIRQSSGDVLVIPDADVMVEPTFLETVWKEHQSCSRLAMYFHRLNEPEDLHDATESYNLDHLKNLSRVTTTSNFGGCLTVRKKWLIEINGYEQNSIFGSGFHANGYDVNTRLKNLGLHIMWHPSVNIYHPWHPGSEAKSSHYKMQHLIVEHKASTMMTKAFQGIDSSMDTELPNALRQKLLAAKEGVAVNKQFFSQFMSKLKAKVSLSVRKQKSV